MRFPFLDSEECYFLLAQKVTKDAPGPPSMSAFAQRALIGGLPRTPLTKDALPRIWHLRPAALNTRPCVLLAPGTQAPTALKIGKSLRCTYTAYLGKTVAAVKSIGTPPRRAASPEAKRSFAQSSLPSFLSRKRGCGKVGGKCAPFTLHTFFFDKKYVILLFALYVHFTFSLGGIFLAHLYRVIRFPKGSDPRYLVWHHLWLSLGLTALGVLLGWLTLPLAAAADSELSSQALMDYYLQQPMLLWLNLLAPVLLIWLLYFLIGRCWAAYLLTALPVLGIALANFYKMQLRGDPLLASDLKLVNEAGGIVGGYTLEITPLIQNTLLWAGLGLLLALILLPRGVRRLSVRLMGFFSAAALLAAALWGSYFSSHLYQQTTPGEELINPWSDSEVYVSHGVLYPFLYTVQTLLPSQPQGYDAQVAQTILESYEEEDIPADQKVNVVGIMLEAFCDLTDFSALGEVEAVQNVYAPWHWLEEHSVSGNLLTNIFAGGTVDTEWCFLTGYSSYDDFTQPTDSYVWYFDRQGYNTRGSHPGYGWFYNRQNINQYLGFQEYWFSENHYEELVDPVGAQWNSDYLLVDEIVKDLQTQLEEDNGPVFSFSVSYQNHGPYEWTYTANEVYLDPEETGLPEESCHVFNNYLHGVSMTISALTGMIHNLEEMEEPVVVVLFGDHKPWGGNGNSAYEGIGADFSLTSLESFYEYYSTPYLIWANSAAKEVLNNDFEGDGGDFSPCFLMQELFDQCGWTGPSYLQFTREVRQATPLVHQQGLYLTPDGQLTDTLEEEQEELVNDLFYVQYYRQHKIDPTGQS